ncbi:hypothetical protein [Streptomyces mirabilis]|uniref:hypothetical protein n=1 Tax=Streptomyces mirabilis TaxID=68239 RepID=UPI0037178D59
MASGSELASWAMVVVPLTGETPPVVCPTLVPASDLSVERTWRAAGPAPGTRHPYFTPYTLAEDHGRVAFDMMPTVSLTL